MKVFMGVWLSVAHFHSILEVLGFISNTLPKSQHYTDPRGPIPIFTQIFHLTFLAEITEAEEQTPVRKQAKEML